MSRRIFHLAALCSALLTLPALAQSIDGEVRKVDKAQQKISLTHGEIKPLDLPAMTMTYRVKDPALLEAVQVGDKIRFSAEKINGQLTVTQIRRP